MITKLAKNKVRSASSNFVRKEVLAYGNLKTLL